MAILLPPMRIRDSDHGEKLALETGLPISIDWDRDFELPWDTETARKTGHGGRIFSLGDEGGRTRKAAFPLETGHVKIREIGNMPQEEGGRFAMKRLQFAEVQITFALRQADTGTKVDEVCRKIGISGNHLFQLEEGVRGAGHSGTPFGDRSEGNPWGYPRTMPQTPGQPAPAIDGR